MNKKELEIILSKLKNKEIFCVGSEQYATDSSIAAEILWTAHMNNDINNGIIADFGCGNGIFGIGGLLLGAKKCYFIDTDIESIKIAKENSKNLDIDSRAIFLNEDVINFNERINCIIQNPPFGVQRKHADKLFLEIAFKLSDKIYSIHKIESENFINEMSKDNGFISTKLFDFDFILKKTMKFHKKEKYSVRVGCWMLKRKI